MLNVDYEISTKDIENTILNLTVEEYHARMDPSKTEDFNVGPFCSEIDGIQIYLKYGLQDAGLQILVFSNHVPSFPMTHPIKN